MRRVPSVATSREEDSLEALEPLHLEAEHGRTADLYLNRVGHSELAGLIIAGMGLTIWTRVVAPRLMSARSLPVFSSSTPIKKVTLPCCKKPPAVSTRVKRKSAASMDLASPSASCC